ncbi:MAG: alkaline phosphatase [Peptococcaceae bacterium BICA1-7]|nr:MAG: alkaline phosphatase [Peptococcaceae bacterium BICA1-7]HBV98645.1 DedA family protein [Desulfotomaculum sp.]
MNVEGLITLVAQYGYGALFFCLWLGIVGMPIPDEVIVMTGGLVSSLHLLKPVPAFLVTYLGVVSGLTLGYVLGLKMGAPILDRLLMNKNVNKYLSRSYGLLDRYGPYALCISYFFPVIRHLVPYLVGISRMSYRRYILLSYTTGLVWTLLFFSVGRFFGMYIEKIGGVVNSLGMYVLIVLLPLCFGIRLIQRFCRN